MRRPFHRPLVVATVVALAACAPPAANSVPGPTNVITPEQIEAVHATNAYEVVERLHGNWLISTVPNSPVLAYIDDQRLGVVSRLREIPIRDVQYIRYFSPTEASARWGLGHGGGVVMVSTDPLEP